MRRAQNKKLKENKNHINEENGAFEKSQNLSDFDYAEETELDNRYYKILDALDNQLDKMVFVLIGSMQRIGIGEGTIDGLMKPVIEAIRNTVSDEEFDKMLTYIEGVIKRSDTRRLDQRRNALH